MGTEFNSSRNLGIARITSQPVSVPVEAFAISIVPLAAKQGTLVMAWGFFKWTAPIEVQ